MENVKEKIIYEVTIKATRLENTLTKKNWVEGGTDEPNTRGYGYTPQVTEVKSIERKIYSQTVEKLDLGAVISAINGF